MKITDGQLRLAATDLSNFLACRHLTRLDMLQIQVGLHPARAADLGLEKLIERGEAHEQRVIELLQERGLEVSPIIEATTDQERVAGTIKAMEARVDVIYQGVLLHKSPGGTELYGRPDFLVRADRFSKEQNVECAASGYEILDAKLARSAKARAVLQCAFYSHLLGEIQGIAPRWLHLALGNGDIVPYRVANFAAYERRIRNNLEDFLTEEIGVYPAIEPYPEPVEHCAICRWRGNCNKKRRSDDDLSLIAGMPTNQRVALKAAGVTQRRQFAELSDVPNVGGANPDALRQSYLQARLQVESEDLGTIKYHLLDPERDRDGILIPNRGLLALPEPHEGDLFFDIEGAPFYSEDGREFGLQYLFGIVDTADVDGDGFPRYVQFWAFDRQGEKEAFEELIDFITARRAVNPGLHVFHYNHYETTSIDHLTELHETREEAVGRLMGRFATHENEVDDLFRLGMFVDLYRVVRQGLRAGVESYSIKKLEDLVGYDRKVILDDANRHLIAFEDALEAGEAAAAGETRLVVAGYNEDDCRSTLALRDWLEERRVELAAKVPEQLPRPLPPVEKDPKVDLEVFRLKGLLHADMPANPDEWSDEERARALLADLLEWHRREVKPAWWRYFLLRSLSSAQLMEEPDAIGGLTGGDMVGHVARSVVRRFQFPPQEYKFASGTKANDPVTNKTWTVVDVDDEHGTIDLKIGDAGVPLPSAVVEGGPIEAVNQEARLRDLASLVVDSGFGVLDPALALLLRVRPSDGGVTGTPLRAAGEPADVAARRIISGLDRSYLPVQGPPGAGKTHTAALSILELVANGRVVGVTGPSHAVIHNLLKEVGKLAKKTGQAPRIGQKPDDGARFLLDGAVPIDNKTVVSKLDDGELDIVAGTAWLWSLEDLIDRVDTLYVDEAGQFSLANVLAISGAVRNLVLLGDPQQLAQPSQAAHPPGAGVSALGHTLGEHDTMPNTAGIFLDHTHRMHPDLCRYTSEVFYENRLTGIEELQHQRISGASWSLPETGLTFVEVVHQGNANASPEEAAEIVRLIGNLIGTRWTDKEDYSRRFESKDVLVVTPFNAQVRQIEKALDAAGIAGVRVGTVDKFQGQEAPAVIYSMASSSSADAPRGLEFLFDLHRLNVATSRARAIAVVVASPDLLRVFCKTPHQMVLANALCRAGEM